VRNLYHHFEQNDKFPRFLNRYAHIEMTREAEAYFVTPKKGVTK
jgi:hypothetical protein